MIFCSECTLDSKKGTYSPGLRCKESTNLRFRIYGFGNPSTIYFTIRVPINLLFFIEHKTLWY